MKTLDEVIKGFEHCKSAECKECPYRILFDDDSHVPCDQFEKDDDALHYLVEYRACQQHMEVVEQIRQDAVRQRDAHIKALAEMKRNDPLTWDELRTMEGKPVWVEERYRNGDLKSAGWWLIDYWNDDHICLRDQGGNSFNTYRGAYGRDWQAYRKELS